MNLSFTFLGHEYTDKGILPDDTKCDPIRKYPVSTNADTCRRFFAICNNYRRFIKNLADYLSHITRLCKKDVKFEWTTYCQHAFEHFKKDQERSL